MKEAPPALNKYIIIKRLEAVLVLRAVDKCLRMNIHMSCTGYPQHY